MRVETVGKFLNKIKELKNYHAEEAVYFRGESKCGWELRPSVVRDGLAQYESEMLTELITRQPAAFDGITYALAQWGLAQHYRLRTRFLDITRNPLVALFHACEGHPGEPGRLHIFAVPPPLVKSFNSDTVSIIANFAKLPKGEQDTLLGRFERSNEEGHINAIGHLLQLIRIEKPYFEERINLEDLYRAFVIEPQQSHDRIRAQSGAFLASAFHQQFERDEVLRHNDRIAVYAHYMLTIPSESKSSIIDELQLLNITRETLFPGLDESASEITERYRSRLAQS